MDYSDFSASGPVQKDISNAKRWWDLSEEEMPGAIASIVEFLWKHQGARQTQLLMSARLYGNLSIMGLNGLSYSRVTAVQNQLRDRIAYNVIQSAIDAVTAKISKNKPKPLFLTSGGDYRLQQKAKKLDKFVEGIFYENQAYEDGPNVFRDGCIFGDGITHVYKEHGRVKHERCPSGELLVDEIEGWYGKPRQLHRVKNVDRDLLIDAFPSKKSKIRDANAATADITGYYQNISDVLTVRESWHLPSGPDAKDGRHIITINNALLLKEPWERDHFPFARFQWNKRVFGFWGQGAAEQIQNIQLEINKLLWVIQRSYHLAGSFKVFLENGSKIVKEHLNNDIGAIVNYTGTRPEYLVPPIVPPEIYTHLQTLINNAFSQLGVSQLSAASIKPAGLDSGKALREYNDIEADRFNTVGHSYENYFLDLARLDIETVKEIHEEDGKFEVQVPGKKFLESIDWKDINLADDEYFMKAYPVSSLPNTPEGRLATIQEYMQAGLMSPRTGRKLLDFPDLEQVEDLANASEEYLNEILEKVVEDGLYTAPEPTDDLSLAKELVLEYISRGKCNGLEEEKLDLLRQFNDHIDLLTQAASPPPPPQDMNPQAAPEAPPVSNMVPNVPQGVQ